MPKSGILEQELKVPVDIIFVFEGFVNHKPVIPTLHLLAKVAKETVEAISNV